MYLLIIALLSVISIGFFWIEWRLSGYFKEVNILKRTYAETKKLEIKNKILQIKDYIQWVQFNPAQPLAKSLATQVGKLKFPGLNSGATARKSPDRLLKALKESVSHSLVPINLFFDSGKLACAFSPFGTTGNGWSAETGTMVRNGLRNENSSGKFILTLYKPAGKIDSTLEAVAYFDHTTLPGYIIASVLTSEYFDRVLREYILDTVSRSRYPLNENVFINSFDGKALVTNGQYKRPPVDILLTGDLKWMEIFRVQQSSAKHQAGIYYSYPWKKLPTGNISLKTSYFSYYPQWKWIIGTGFHEDDVNSEIELNRRALYADMRRDLINISLYLVLSSFLCYLFVLFFSKRLTKNIKLFTDFFEKAETENILIDESLLHYSEFTRIAAKANHMIMERQRTETALLKSEEKFSKAFRNSPDAIIITEFSGNIFEVNESMERISGYSREELIGKSIIDICLWTNSSDRGHYLELLQEHGRVQNIEFSFRKKSGELITGLISGEIIEFGGCRYILSVIRDITAYKNMEQALLGLEHRFRETLENVNLISILLDLTGKITFCNSYLLELTGYTSEEVLGKNWFRLFIPDSHPEVEKIFVDNLQASRIIPFNENEILTKNGETRIIHFSNTLLRDAKGNVIGTTSIGEDITERIKAADEILKLNFELESRVKERTHQLESINKELESFSYSISHDLRAPLRAIYGFSQILASRHRPTLNDEGRQYMDYIVEASIRMETLINDLLQYSRLGRKGVVLHPVSIKSVIDEIAGIFKQRLDDINACFHPDNDLPEISGDETLLRQIFINLIDNAIAYRRMDVPLKIDIRCRQDGNFHIIEMTDNGIGIPKEHWEKIFNVFQRLHSDEKYSGTGIGLATVKKAVNLLGGSIWVESVVGEGSTFFIKLPSCQI
jgi:PAS domain S-box-containing protein